jgi:hypothetical protein
VLTNHSWTPSPVAANRSPANVRGLAERK